MDTVTLAIAIGLLVSLLFTELFGLTGGGMIVPGYLALYWSQPLSVVITLVAAALTYILVRQCARFMIIYGRRRIVMMVVFGFLVGAGVRCLTDMFAATGFANGLPECFCVIGFIIPGLIALWMDRQGVVQTLAPLLTSSVMVRLVLVLVGVEVAL